MVEREKLKIHELNKTDLIDNMKILIKWIRLRETNNSHVLIKENLIKIKIKKVEKWFFFWGNFEFFSLSSIMPD